MNRKILINNLNYDQGKSENSDLGNECAYKTFYLHTF